MKQKSNYETPYTLQEWADLILVWASSSGERISAEEALARAKADFEELTANGEPLPCPADMMK